VQETSGNLGETKSRGPCLKRRQKKENLGMQNAERGGVESDITPPNPLIAHFFAAG
jgi:hypothetical protein